MSHLVIQHLVVQDLDVLKAAAEKCGLELMIGQKTHRWYGRFMGDYPMPEGMTREQMGKCEHAIRVVGAHSIWNQTYEIGLVKNPKGPGFVMIYDFWQGGYGLEEKAGKNLNTLKQAYATEVARRQLARKGYRIQEQHVDGRVVLKAVRS